MIGRWGGREREREMRRRGATVALAIGMAVVLAGCQWMSSGWDASGSSDNDVDTTITVANVSTLHPEWSAALASVGVDLQDQIAPVAWENLVYAVGGPGVGSQLQAYAANGAGCTGSPRVCTPQWVANGHIFTQPLAVDGVVLVGDFGTLEAYDAAGAQDCTGSAPAMCTPLWTSSVGGYDPIYAGGLVYAATADGVAAFALDPSGCTGTPVTCAPVATYSDAAFCGTAPVCEVQALVADGSRVVAQITSASGVPIGTPGRVFGEPRPTSTPSSDPPITYGEAVVAWTLGGSSTPAWETDLETSGPTFSTPGLMDADGHVEVAGASGDLVSLDPASGSVDWAADGLAPGLAADPDAVLAHGAASVDACDPSGGCSASSRAYATAGATVGPVIDDGIIFVADGGHGAGSGTILAFDASGSTGCSGAPLTCQPLAALTLPSHVTRLSATNGRLYAMTADGHLSSLTPSA